LRKKSCCSNFIIFFPFPSVTRDLGSFLADLRETVQQSMISKKLKLKIASVKQHRSGNHVDETTIPSNSSHETFDYGAFLDAKGHYVGFCSGCEKWHTGIVWLQRHAKEIIELPTPISGDQNVVEAASVSDTPARKLDVSPTLTQTGTKTGTVTRTDTCMTAWETILLSGRFNTDQESLDEAERIGACPSALVLPGKHLLFAKDYIGMALTAGQTFLHLTAAG
jgi:hypothetical protein